MDPGPIAKDRVAHALSEHLDGFVDTIRDVPGRWRQRKSRGCNEEALRHVRNAQAAVNAGDLATAIASFRIAVDTWHGRWPTGEMMLVRALDQDDSEKHRAETTAIVESILDHGPVGDERLDIPREQRAVLALRLAFDILEDNRQLRPEQLADVQQRIRQSTDLGPPPWLSDLVNALLRIRLGRLTEAAGSARDVMSIIPEAAREWGQAHAGLVLSLALAQLGRHHEASQLLEQIRSLAPHDCPLPDEIEELVRPSA